MEIGGCNILQQCTNPSCLEPGDAEVGGPPQPHLLPIPLFLLISGMGLLER